MSPMKQFCVDMCKAHSIDPDELVAIEDFTGRNAGLDNSNNYVSAWTQFGHLFKEDDTDTSKPDLTMYPLDIVIHTKSDCPWCDAAKQFLTDHNLPFSVVNHDDPKDRLEFYNSTNTKSVPQVFLDGSLIGGYLQLIGSGIQSLEKL